MDHDMPAYGLWSLVVINSLVFIFFAFSFFRPRTGRDWRTFGAFTAFIVALFVESFDAALGKNLSATLCRHGGNGACSPPLGSDTTAHEADLNDRVLRWVRLHLRRQICTAFRSLMRSSLENESRDSNDHRVCASLNSNLPIASRWHK